MAVNDLSRRRSPAWVRQWTSRDIHAVLGRFDRERTSEDLTEPQEWLYDACISELEYRHRRTRRLLERCWCRYCVPPFPD